MTASDGLFHLVKSLAPNEKRYFKVWATTHVKSSNQYEKLFDAVDALPDDKPYDEAAFKKTLRGKSYGRHLSDEKSYLYEMLLKAMRLYHAEKTAQGRLGGMLQEIRFLLSKGLVEQCRSQITRALEIADSHELLEARLQLIRYMVSTDMSAYDDRRYAEAGRWRALETETMTAIDLEREAYYLREELLYPYYGRQMDRKKAEVDALYAQFEEIEKEPGISFNTLQCCINSRAIILESRTQYMDAVALYHKLILEFENLGPRLSEHIAKYETVIKNCLTQLFRAEAFDEMPPLLEKYKSIPTTDERVRGIIFVNYWQLSMIYYLNMQRYADAHEVLPELQKGFKEFEAVMVFKDKINLLGNIYIVHLKTRDYRGMLGTFDRIYQAIGRRTDYNYVFREIKFLEFIGHFETGGIDILDSHIRNSQRFLKDNGMNNDYTDMLWRQMRRLISCEPSKIKSTRADIKLSLATAGCPESCAQINELVSDWL